MAYLNFSPLQGDSVAAPADLLPKPRPNTGFSALEWQVVAIAQKDRLSSLRNPSRLGTALGVVFGSRRANPRLADPALEALRRLAVLAWHRGYAIPDREVRTFHDAGYTPDQYDALLASISRGRATQNRA
ncbi:hypothetical protein LQ953_01965 [Sphingomonas sp. IC-56]|uniref:hypothetical protein n=1 Tax=Sphingomonas sp. IC-56 TaxID=2898529 RepID=UPI001E48EBE0|nr:hypothetical protein [Sphingomonas sp. IC-56]MCD2322778.1 hypothetical protein [Sphingomonas sp. IC-56]